MYLCLPYRDTPSVGLEKSTWTCKADLVMAPQPPSAKNGTLQSDVDIPDEQDRRNGPPPPKRSGDDDCKVSFTECMRRIGLTAAAMEKLFHLVSVQSEPCH